MKNPSLRLLLSPVLLALSLSGCSCGDVIVLDGFAPPSEDSDVLHTYASRGKVRFTVRAVDGFDLERIAEPEASGSLSLDPDIDVTNDGLNLTFGVITGDAGSGTLRFVDEGGADVAVARDVDVVEVDAIAVSVTAPNAPGLELPEVNPSAVRVFAERRAAFRTTLFSGDDEVFALEAVEASAPLGPGRPCLACADDTCEASRAALEFLAPATVDPIDVVLTAGSASLTLTVQPTLAADVTDVVLDEGGLFEERQSVVARVLAGTEPVFGAPVQWSVDGDVLENDNGDAQLGDALRYTPSSTSRVVQATLGARALDITVSGDEFEVSAITFACGSAPAASVPLAALALLLGLRRRRRG